MRRRALLSAPAVALILLVIAAALFTDLFGGQLIPGLPQMSLQRVERFQSSTITLIEMRSVAELAGVQLIHRTVFPYDYLPEGVSIADVLRRLRTSDGPIEETLSADELLFYRTFDLAREINLGNSADTFDFVVVSLVVTAGYRLDDQLSVVIEPDGEFAEETGRRANVELGEPVILSRRVEDFDPERYPYPDASVSADGWRQIAEFVLAQGIPPDREQALFFQARERAEHFVRTMLMQAGIDEVAFE